MSINSYNKTFLAKLIQICLYTILIVHECEINPEVVNSKTKVVVIQMNKMLYFLNRLRILQQI